MIQAKRSFVKCGDWFTGISHFESWNRVFSPIRVNNEKICCKNSGDKITVCERTAGPRSGKFSDLNSGC